MGGIQFLSEPEVSDLTLFICETFKEEITRIVTDISGCKIRICLFPHHCTSGSSGLEDIRSFLTGNIKPGQTGLYFGDTHLATRGSLPPEISHVGPDTCNALIAPAEWLATLISGGAYVVLPGWLFSWEYFITKMGFDPLTPTTFYSSTLKEIVVLDTGVIPIPEDRIISFERFTGLPVRTIPVGISYISAIIHEAICQWQVARIRSTYKLEVGAALESSARQMTVITLISNIARVTEEKDVISRIIMTCQALFAPRSVRYLSIEQRGLGQMTSIPPDPDEEKQKTLLISALGTEYIFSLEQTGFIVPVLYQQETLGILGVFDVLVPERIREYLNLTLSLTRFLGLAIRNSRSWCEIRETRDKLEELNSELRGKNEELLAISDELHQSNQELIKSKQVLIESEQFIKGIVSSAQVGIGVLDQHFHILFWNNEMERMFGRLYTAIQGQNYLEVFAEVKQYKRDEYLFQALNGEVAQAPDFEYSAKHISKPIWISSIYSPVYDLDQNIIGVVINVYDITERKKAEQDMEHAYDAIHTAQEKLAILSSITRHDILNRVMVINAYSEILTMSLSDEKLLKQVNNIAIAGKDIQHLIEFTREYQELGVKKPTWQQIERVMKRRTVQSVISGIDLSIQGITVEIFVDPMFEKVMYNLVENSIRHGEGVSKVSIYTELAGEDLVITYADNGVGVATEEKELIFKQGHGKNTGMGLFLIREILELTHITIRECGVPGEGVRFLMTIPKNGWRIINSEGDIS